MESDPLAGKTLGQYRIVRLLGKGGMSAVYEGIQAAINRTVAVKVLPRSLMHDDTFMQRFRREAEVVAHLEHLHILPIYDYGEYDGIPYIVMRYLEGGTVQDRIKEGPLPVSSIASIIRQIASALDYAHGRNVVHRDIKPSNILLDPDGNAYLADFGIAKVHEGTAQLTGSGIVGTPAYMAPEQSQSSTPYPSADIYALGVTLFEMLTGALPLIAADTPIGQILMHIQQPVPSLASFRPELPPHLDAVVQRAMSKEPAHRYRTAGDMARALDDAIRRVYADETVTDAPLNVSRETAPIASRQVTQKQAALPMPDRGAGTSSRPGLWVGGGVALLAVTGLVIAGFSLGWFGGTTAEATPTEFPVAAIVQPTLAATETVAPMGAPTLSPIPTQIDAATNLPTLTAEPSVTPSATATLEPTALAAQTTLRGVPMILVPAGPFIMGINTSYPRERPEHEVFLADYYIDETEVTNLYYRECVEAGACEEPEFVNTPGGQIAYWGQEFYYDYPVVFLSWYQADTYCRWRGGHLPTEAQWEKAARWDAAAGSSRQFPWTPPVLDPYYANYGNLIGYPVEARSYPGGVSPFGLYDMSGNVGEWVNDWYSDNYYEASPAENPPGPGTGTYKVVRGGSYDSQGSAVSATFREYFGPATKYATLACAAPIHAIRRIRRSRGF
jgi:serine/threonine-protein kinase